MERGFKKGILMVRCLLLILALVISPALSAQGPCALPGDGNFVASDQALGILTSNSVVLGDIDGDDDLDLVTGEISTNHIYLNDGAGNFTDSGMDLKDGSIYESYGVDLGDVDGDGTIDAFVANYNDYNKVWLNDPPQKIMLYTEGAAAKAVTSNISLTDDGATLVGAAVKVSGGYVNGEDELGFTAVSYTHLRAHETLRYLVCTIVL